LDAILCLLTYPILNTNWTCLEKIFTKDSSITLLPARRACPLEGLENGEIFTPSSLGTQGQSGNVLACAGCGAEGYDPKIQDPGFREDLQRKIVLIELVKSMDPLYLNAAGLCKDCQSMMLKHEDLDGGGG
jgi:hypothetical protein